jgi:hypothetical protein
MKQTDEIAEMRGTMKSFIDFELAAKQRLEIRVETEALIEKAKSLKRPNMFNVGMPVLCSHFSLAAAAAAGRPL